MTLKVFKFSQKISRFSAAGFGLLILLVTFFSFRQVWALSIEELRAKIDERNKAIAELEAEIADSQKQIDALGTEAKTLQNTLKTLDAARKKFLTQIKVTEAKIAKTRLMIDELSSGIKDKEQTIEDDAGAIGSLIREFNNLESSSVVEVLLRYENLSSFWNDLGNIELFSGRIKDRVISLKAAKARLETSKAETEAQKRQLEKLSRDLADQKKIVELNQVEKDRLLKETKNKESNYRKILADRVAKRDAFEAELLEYESQLKFAIDPSSLPSVGSGVLKWPLDSVKITQYFGKTDFATKNPQIYNGAGHNGIDLRASVGTAVKSALLGVVKAIGDTDSVCPGASYGKWVLVEHQNGLSTLYAHLSLIKVGPGQSLAAGETLGYSGDTGYGTGPHLHFTVYATQGVRVMTVKSRVCQGSYTMPLADLKAYLNPLSYL